MGPSSYSSYTSTIPTTGVYSSTTSTSSLYSSIYSSTTLTSSSYSSITTSTSYSSATPTSSLYRGAIASSYSSIYSGYSPIYSSRNIYSTTIILVNNIIALLELPIPKGEASNALVEGIPVEDILVGNILGEGIPVEETPGINNILREKDTASIKDIASKVDKVVKEEIIIGSASAI